MDHSVVQSLVLTFPSSFVGAGVLPYGMGLGPCVQDREVVMTCLVNVGFTADVSGQVVIIRSWHLPMIPMQWNRVARIGRLICSVSRTVLGHSMECIHSSDPNGHPLCMDGEPCWFHHDLNILLLRPGPCCCLCSLYRWVQCQPLGWAAWVHPLGWTPICVC